MKKIYNSLEKLSSVLLELRQKCPWDKKQTNESLRHLTIEEVYEPFLIQQGFIIRTPRGRQVTEKGYNHLGRNKNNQNKLFN